MGKIHKTYFFLKQLNIVRLRDLRFQKYFCAKIYAKNGKFKKIFLVLIFDRRGEKRLYDVIYAA